MLLEALGGTKRLKFISQLVVLAWCASLSSLPPQLAIVALVVTDIVDSAFAALRAIWK